MEASLRERAEAEADEAEATETDEDETEDDETAAAEETETEPTALIDDAAIRKAERAIADQKTRLAKILGDEMVAHDCPLCSALGYLPELPPPGATLEVVETDDGVSFNILAPGVPPELKDARDKVACDWCDGYGQVRSGSKFPPAAVVPCTKCLGNGWQTVAADAPQTIYVPSPTGAVPNGATNQPMQVPDDAWGRPYGHPHYGMPPSMVGVEVP